MESWRREFYHSAKGTTWSDHKYIRKEGNRYIYKDDNTAERDKKKLEAQRDEIDYDRTQFQGPNQFSYLNALFKQKFNVEFLKQDPDRVLVYNREDDSYYSPQDYIDYYEEMVDKYFEEIDAKNKKIAEIDRAIALHAKRS